MFDNICEFLVENFASDFATWLLGEPITRISHVWVGGVGNVGREGRLEGKISSSSSHTSHPSHTPGFFAGLVLNQDIIQQLLRRELMQESVTYQALMNEGRAEGRVEGIEEGVRLVALNLLREGVADEVVIKVTGLSAENIQQLKLTELESENRG